MDKKKDAVSAENIRDDKLILGGHKFNFRFILGSGKYNVELITAAVEQAGAEIITLALKRANTESDENIIDKAKSWPDVRTSTGSPRKAAGPTGKSSPPRGRGNSLWSC